MLRPTWETQTWVRARDLATPLGRALSLRTGDDARDAASILQMLQYDYAPVIHDGVWVGVFKAVDGARCGDQELVLQVMTPLAARHIVSSETPLNAIMARLCEEPFLFVLEQDSIDTFVTSADLASVPVRTHFYLRLAQLEQTLGRYLRSRYADQSSAIALLARPRQEAQAKIADELRGKDKFIDDLACLSLTDLLTLASKDGSFRTDVQRAGVGWRRAIRGLSDFRNDVMHAARPFARATDTHPAKLLEWDERLAALVLASTGLSTDAGPLED